MNKYPYKSSHIDYLQIGAHIGNSIKDPIFNIPITNKNLILIEPVPFLYNLLKYNYRSKMSENEIEFLNIAVSDKDGDIDMIVPDKNNKFNDYPQFLNEMSSTTDKYIKKWKFAERFPDFKFINTTVPCRRFNTIIQDRGIKSIYHLIIDTEGHDYTILMDIDFNLIRPINITFENAYIDDDDTKLNYMKLLNHLKSFGYKITSEDEWDTTVTLVSSDNI